MSDPKNDEYPDEAGYPDGEGTLDEGTAGAVPADPGEADEEPGDTDTDTASPEDAEPTD